MASAADLRTFALALEGAMEVPHFGSPSFRVGGKIFAQISDKTNDAILKLDPAHQEMLFAAQPEVFVSEVWGKIRWTRVHLAAVSKADLKVLIREAWQTAKSPAKAKAKRPK